MPNKLVSLAEAIAAIPDGAGIAPGGQTLHRSPSAALHELIRQGKQQLHLIKSAGAYDVDVLCGTGNIASLTTAYVGFEQVLAGPPLNYRRAQIQGRLQVQAFDRAALIAGLRAAAFGLPFMPVAGLLNSACQAANRLRPVADPYSGQELLAVPAIIPDVAIIHVHEADPAGNARILGALFDDQLLANAARSVILTCERIVNPARLSGLPEMTRIPGMFVDAVVHAPRGAWPTSCAGSYALDEAYLQIYHTASSDPATFQAFLANHILNADQQSGSGTAFPHR
jgi:glutaconate CoA-transferase subunit A